MLEYYKKKRDCFISQKERRRQIISKNRNKSKEGDSIFDEFSRNALKIVFSYLFFAVIVIIIFKTLLMVSLIPSESMEGTISKGDIVLSTRYGIREEDIKRYDILLFTLSDEPDTTYIKRVIGLPGETVEVKDGRVYADGVEVDDSFVDKPMNRKGDGTYVVPESCYFLLGDNRNNSKDSRFWKEKYIPVGNIQAKARFIIFPFSNIQHIK